MGFSVTHGWGFDDTELEKFRNALVTWGKDWEVEGTKTMHKYAPLVRQSMKSVIPTSDITDRQLRARGFNHSNAVEDSLEDKLFHMGFRVKTTSSRSGFKAKGNAYGYLIFPNEGRGWKNPIRQDFTGQAIKANKEPLFRELDRKIADLYIRSVKL